MVWKTIHIQDDAKAARHHIARYLKDPDAMEEVAMPPERPTIAIVGGGPKGMYALERLLNDLTASAENDHIHILWVNESKDFGSGNNYQVDQPDYLLINYCIGNIDAWNREIVNANIPSQPTLLDWVKTYRNNDTVVRPTDYASRALVGCYLQATLQQILDSVPPHVSISLVQAKVEDIRYAADFSIKLHASSTLLKADYLLLATGHCYENNSLISADAVQSELRGNYFKSAYPVKKLDMIPAQADVAVVGLGLTFIDAVLHLTEGRGGKFAVDGSYLPSGEEPRVYAFSRKNVPILPRGPIYGEERYQLRPATIAQLQAFQTVMQEQHLDFNKELYPVLNAEAQYAYYSTLLNDRDERVVARHIATLSERETFTLDNLLFPESVSDHEAMLKLLRDTIAHAESGELQAPLLAASAVWREATKWVGELYQYAGFTSESQEVFDTQFFGAFCRTSFGPPIENMKKVWALAEAGILRFPATENPTIHYKSDGVTFEIKGENNSFACSYLIDARIGRSNLKKKNAPLYSALYQAGLVTAFANGEYQPGCVAMDTDGRTTASPNGSHPPLFFYGTPTEGVLLDNDSLSRKRNDTGSSWSNFVVNDLLSLQKNNTHEAYSER
ncbi:FAD/NAD(P)-binding protein [Sphingobacterium deserti]|uniref:Pyridoxal-phosphate dependent enzyme n=1 Tax=Sphingobacterium deserti TaxID=1229276 RepID=A0A0B8T7N6_9SPHI|nr:FAD/NAD(P)-binding protein [Sphingobacterium deserti]KGE13760.1 pyridoxal-phosphate dependent enzyme [Sphingobacterium deserti]